MYLIFKVQSSLFMATNTTWQPFYEDIGIKPSARWPLISCESNCFYWFLKSWLLFKISECPEGTLKLNWHSHKWMWHSRLVISSSSMTLRTGLWIWFYNYNPNVSRSKRIPLHCLVFLPFSESLWANSLDVHPKQSIHPKDKRNQDGSCFFVNLIKM